MHTCNICLHESADAYAVDGHFICDDCLMRGRLGEMPDFGAVEENELEPVGEGATVSSWWNRQIPEAAAR